MEYNPKFVYNVREIHTLRELLESSYELHSDKPAFLIHHDESYKEITYAELLQDVKAFSTYLNSLGLKGDKIAVVGKNSYNWALTYLAV